MGATSMADRDTGDFDADDWAAFAADVNESFLDAFERNLQAQAEFVDRWTEMIEEDFASAAPSAETADSYARAHQVWMDAAEAQYTELLEGGDISATAARDRWLDASNQAFKEIMGTSAFAAATGRTIQRALEAQRLADDAAEETLHALRFATRSDVHEVGERLVELERRQHSVEETLERILDELRE